MPTFDDAFADDTSLSAADDGALWLGLSISRLDREHVFVRRLQNGEVEEFSPFAGDACRPRVCASPGSCVATASVLLDGRLQGVAAQLPENRVVWSSECDGDVFDVACVNADGRLWLAWDEISPEQTELHVAWLADGHERELQNFPAMRTAQLDAAGNVVWMVAVEGGADRQVAVLRNAGDGWRRVATLDSTTAEAPTIAALSADRAVVAWHEEVASGLRWLRAVYIEGDEVRPVELPDPPAFDRTTAPCDQGWEFPSVAAWQEDGEVAVALLGRSSQNFHVAFGNTERLGALVAQSPPGWGGCGRVGELARVDGELLFARRERAGVVIETVVREAALLDPARPDYGDEEVDAPAPPAVEPDDVIFGQFHQHSAHSDGTGSVWDVLLRAKRSGVGFTALTDHDRFCGKAIGPATWRYMRVIFDHLTDDQFVVLPAVEFTGARHPGPGHKNVYFESAPPDAIPEHTIEELTEMLEEHAAIVIPHHVGFTGWDIEHHDPDFQPLWEICSVHGVYEDDDPDTVFMPRDDALLQGHTLRAALDAGHRFGFCAGADDHGLLYHHGATPRCDPSHSGLTAVIGADHSRRSILEALRARRCYATTGARIVLEVTLDDAPMGSDLDARDHGNLRVRTTGTAPLAGLDIVRRGSVETIDADGIELELERELEFSGSDYVYVRVRQTDHDMAWSSPIFVG